MDLLNLGLGNRMATTPSKAQPETDSQLSGTGVSPWPRGVGRSSAPNFASQSQIEKPSRQDALQALLAFSALHEQVRRRRALASHLAGRKNGDATGQTALDRPAPEFEQDEQLVLDEVLQLVAERAVAITGANGLAIALAENSEIVLRASAGTIKPDVGARIDRDSAFSGACFRTAQIVRCDDTESDPRVNAQACRALGARSMVAVPLCGRRRVIGLLEAFSTEPYGFNDSDVRSLSLLAELVLGALKPEDEDRFAESAQVASAKLESSSASRESAVESLHGANANDAVPSKGQNLAKADQIPAVDLESAPPMEVRSTSSPSGPSAGDDDILETFGSVQDAVQNLESQSDEILDPEIRTADSEITKTSEDTVEKIEPAHSRPGLVVLVACVIIAMLAGAGIWWKTKNVPLGNAIVNAGKATSSAITSRISPGEAHPAPANPAPATGVNSKIAANPNANSDGLPDAGLQTANSSSPQELAKLPHVTAIRHWSSADSSTVVLDLQDQVQYEAHRLTSPDRIYFDLHDTVLAPEVAATSIEIGDALLNRIRVAQPLPGMTRVVLETRGNSNFSVSLETNPYRLVVEVRKIGSNPKGAVNLFPDTADAEKNALAIIVPPPSKEDLQLRARVPKMRIVVDAGHGGWDLGTVGRRGLLEKDVVLEVAQRLGKLLESRLGMDVLYTRQDDNYIPLDERAEIANQAQADLFVSVHANYSDLPSARGVETYYTNFFSAPSTRDKDRETRASSVAIPTPATATLSAADLHERIEQSRRLAASVQRSLYGALSVENPGLRDRGIKEAGFVVLTETAMPGIL